MSEACLEPELPDTLEAAHQVIRAQAQTIHELRERLQHLEELLGLHSGNSSQPPSSDKKKRKRRLSPLHRDTGNARGGQPGHKGSHREKLPEAAMKEVIPCPPEAVCACGGIVQSSTRPYRHQVFDLPELKLEAREYQIFCGCCLSCGQQVQGKLPPGVPKGMLGARLLALAGLLSSHYHLSKANICALLSDLFGLKVTPGMLSAQEESLSEALKPLYQEVHAWLQQQGYVNVDETGSRQGNADGLNPEGKKAWTWVMTCSQATLFRIALSRGQQAAQELLGKDFAGIVGCDRWSAYFYLPVKQRAQCWPHLLREFQRMSERQGEAGEIGQKLLEQGYQLFSDWHRVLDGELARTTFEHYARSIRRNVKELLEQGANYSIAEKERSERAKTARTCRSLLNVEPALWTFVRKEGIEPSNNAAERALRPVVVKRKVCYGTQSERGSRFQERIFTAVATCRQQGRQILDTFTQAIEAHFGLGIRPSLVSHPP